jgi:glutamyl-tRNA reductase
MEQLLYVGATHKTAALALREKLAPVTDRVPLLLAELARIADERLVLSTCGRFEIYLVQDRDRHRRWPDWLSSLVGLPRDALTPHVRALSGRDAARRALRVAAGLESRILGEDQILSQVRRAFQTALLERSAGPVLSAMFRAAIHAGRRVRCETPLRLSAGGFARLAVRQALAAVPRNGGATVVVLGAGVLAKDVAMQLARRDNLRLVIVGRHLDRAARLARPCGAEAVGLDRLGESLRTADLLIGCAAASGPIVSRDELDARAKPLHVIDLGVPRNVAADAAALPFVTLTHLDMIKSPARADPRAVRDAEAIVEDELQRFAGWMRARRAAPAIVRLHRWADRLEPGARRTVRRALHRRIVRLKEAVA